MSFRKRKKVEYRPTEGDPRNTQASFPLQDFKMWKFSTFSEFAFYVLLLLALLPTVNSNETPTPRMCAVCLDKDCTIGVRRIFPAGGDIAVWLKENSQTAIQDCTMENLKADAPCKMADGSLVLQSNEMHHFEGIDTYDVRRVFNSQILPCADLNLPPSSTPSPVTKTPIHNTPTPAALNDSVADNKGIIIISSVISSVVIIIIFIIYIRFLIWKHNSRGQGQDRDHRHGNNGVPPHDAEDPDEIIIEMQPLNAEVPNGNVNGVH